MGTPTLTKWAILGAIAVLVIVAALGTIYLWHTWPTSSGPGAATSTPQEQAPASPTTLNTSAQELQQSEAQANSASSSPAALKASQKALEQAQRANPGGAGAASSATTQAQLQASQNALQQAEAQQKVQEQ